MVRATKEAVQLFHDGALVLSRIQGNGLRIDRKYLKRAIKRVSNEVKQMERELLEDKIFKKYWKRRFGSKANLGNMEQLGKVVFEDLGYTRKQQTTKNKSGETNDEKAFEGVDHPFVKKYFQLSKKEKGLGTYLEGIEKELVGDRIHPFINLNTVASYRSSSNRNNIQNQPVRDLEMAAMVRQCYIAEDGYVIGEIDYGGIEVCISACFHEDPVMMEYITDPTTDMHRDLASQCYKLDLKKIPKEFWKSKDPKSDLGNGHTIRYAAKNMFVFPQFYGSFYKDCAINMWEAIDLFHLTLPGGVSLRKHLKKQGITERGECNKDDKNFKQQKLKEGTFEKHLNQVELDFWNNRFKVYKQWKYNWWEEYCEKGYFRLKSGFVCKGRYDRKQVCNYPIQGTAFHCLLWSLVKIEKWLRKNKMKTRIIAEIHDSIVFEFYIPEIEKVLKKCKQIMCEDIREHWKWIIVPLTIEAEIAPEGKSWYDKKKVDV